MIKRLFDIVFSLLILVLASPLFVLVSVAILLSSPGPILYRGKRVGLYGKPFSMYKFRTMVRDADKIGGPTTSEDDRRVTSVGRMLRKFKLDELPQFINVLKGEMSVVGPRPEVQEVVDLYTEREKPILSVKPGITDYASLWNFDEGQVVKGAKDPHKAYLEKIWPTKVALQLTYVKEQSFLADMRIILRTIKQLIYGRN